MWTDHPSAVIEPGLANEPPPKPHNMEPTPSLPPEEADVGPPPAESIVEQHPQTCPCHKHIGIQWEQDEQGYL